MLTDNHLIEIIIKERKQMENYKLISEFMGVKVSPKIEYSSDWDCLIPVVHKIKETDLDFDALEIGLPINEVYE